MESEVILGNSNARFSGVTSTMLQCLEYQRQWISVRVLGKHFLPDGEMNVKLWELITLAREPLPGGRWRVFHARRNDEMIQALLLKHVFGVKIKILFTSTAQRNHTGFTRWLMAHMDAVISTCQAAASYLSEPPKAIVPHGVRTDIYFPANKRSEELAHLGVHTRYAIGIFGRVREQKGVHLFVKACIDVLKNNPDYTALIVGAITAKNKNFVAGLKEQIQQAHLQDRILFLGEQPFEKIPRLFRAMSLVAALSDNEGFGLTVLEAMSSGAAVLATEAGAWPEVIEQGKEGYVVPVDDQPAITEKLDSLLSDPVALENMGRAGRQKALEKYTVEREAKQLCEIYRSLQ
ncbi:mannosyltransferase [Alteromonadaceae bacterium Bs31]|nr:mannosyltransferase [Alteromonadaceae bacterium Bs31]